MKGNSCELRGHYLNFLITFSSEALDLVPPGLWKCYSSETRLFAWEEVSNGRGKDMEESSNQKWTTLCCDTVNLFASVTWIYYPFEIIEHNRLIGTCRVSVKEVYVAGPCEAWVWNLVQTPAGKLGHRNHRGKLNVCRSWSGGGGAGQGHLFSAKKASCDVWALEWLGPNSFGIIWFWLSSPGMKWPFIQLC